MNNQSSNFDSANFSTPETEDFWSPSQPISDFPDLSPETQSALERLGPTPFPKSGFPFLGFLATVYDHVATHVGAPANPAKSAGE